VRSQVDYKLTEEVLNHAQRQVCSSTCFRARFFAGIAQAESFTYVSTPANDNIQNVLISTFPTGNFTANNALATLSASGAPLRIFMTDLASMGRGIQSRWTSQYSTH